MKLDKFTQQKIVADTYERKVAAGDILIQQGDTGSSAAQLYVVKSGKFEVLERRNNVMFKVIPTLVLVLPSRDLSLTRPSTHGLGQHQGARRLLRGDQPHVQLPSFGHCSGHH